MIRLAATLAAIALASPTVGQAPAAAPRVSGPIGGQVHIPAGTVIDLVTTNALSSRKNVKGDLLYLKVTAPVLVGDLAAIPIGTVVVAQIARADERNTFGRSGKLDVQLLYAELPSGPLRVCGVLIARGKKGAGDDAATALAFFALPFVATGRSAEIPAGTEVSGRIDRDIWIDTR